MKKLLSIMIAAAMLVSAMGTAVTANAAETTAESTQAVNVVQVSSDVYGDFEYRVYGDTVTITKYTGNGGNVKIPSEIDGKPVTSIGQSAFYGCAELASITVPDSVTYVGMAAFADTAWYDNQPDGVIYAGKCAIDYKIAIDDNGQKVTSEKTLILDQETKCIGELAFAGCSGLTSVIIPDSVTAIGPTAFGYCPDLTSVTIPDSVTSISSETFICCTALTSVTIPESVTSIELGAFYDCPDLTIYGYSGSYAETYAIENDIPFEVIDSDSNPTTRKLGDVDGDGKVSAKDAMLIQRYAIHMASLDDTQLLAADIDGDGRVTAKDAIAVMRFTIGYKVEGLAK